MYMIIFSTIMAVSWVGYSIYLIFRKQKNLALKIIHILAGTCIMIGSIGWFGSLLVGTGVLDKLPINIEWPVRRAKNVINTDRYFIVPLIWSGRIQIYTHETKFVKGWAIESEGGSFKVVPINNEKFYVYVERSNYKYTYSVDGTLLASEKYPQGTYEQIKSHGFTLKIPMSSFLTVFSNPFISWFSLALGMFPLVFLRLYLQWAVKDDDEE